MISRSEMADLQERIFDELRIVRDAGQKEYAHAEDNAMGNFERIATKLRLTREQVLLVYFEKHLDGIVAYINGHRSQREPVEGRIKDAIMYLMLLRGMIEDDRIASELARSMSGPPPHD